MATYAPAQFFNGLSNINWFTVVVIEGVNSVLEATDSASCKARLAEREPQPTLFVGPREGVFCMKTFVCAVCDVPARVSAAEVESIGVPNCPRCDREMILASSVSKRRDFEKSIKRALNLAKKALELARARRGSMKANDHALLAVCKAIEQTTAHQF